MFAQQSVFYTKDYKLELLHYVEEHTLKCGEIYRYSNGNLSLTCVLCDRLEFSSLSAYALHIDEHYNVLLQDDAPNRIHVQDEEMLEFVNFQAPDPVSYVSDTVDAQPMNETEKRVNRKRKHSKLPVTHNRFIAMVNPAPRKVRQKIINIAYACDHCDEKYRRKQDLADHLMDVHQVGHGCEYCGKQYKLKSNLVEHIRSHTGERPFACHMCPAHFASSTTLQSHIRYHIGEKPFLCSDCGRGFTVRSQLTRHNQLHHAGDSTWIRERHACMLCDRKFMSAAQLRDHMFSHSKEKNIVCDICSRKFTLRKHIVQHMQLHSGVKSHCCRYCGAAFAQSTGRRNHEKTNHELKAIF